MIHTDIHPISLEVIRHAFIAAAEEMKTKSRTGVTRVQAVFHRHGRETTRAAIDAMLRQGEARVRQAIRAMPDGVYVAESCLDDDCIGNGPLPVKVKVIIQGDEVTIDLMGSSPQNPGPVNCGLPATLAACRIALKCITDPQSPVTEGDFAPLRLIVPEQCMYHASPT